MARYPLFTAQTLQLISDIFGSESQKVITNIISDIMKQSNKQNSVPSGKSKLGAMQESRYENSARKRMADATNGRGSVDKGGMARTMGSATKDSKHGLHTDHGASRRTESRRDGSMGSESKSKSNRKNV